MESNQTESNRDQQQDIASVSKNLLQIVADYLRDLLDFREDTDREETLKAIQADIPFKGATTWVLIFAIFVASIGLNADSTAVVIGAMLISPLMGPIIGIGSAFALNDIDIFKKSSKSLLTMVVLSILTSFIYFYVFPGGGEDTSELLGRTRPDIRDVLIAFFGGLALMVARTKKGTIASVIFGVAIATALMPPLCTAGFGLAKGFSGELIGFEYALGALFLFTINTIFIALATFIVLKLVRFPMHKYANSKQRKQYATIATVVGILVMVPAIYTFINVLNESRMKSQFNNYITNVIDDNPSYQLLDKEFDPVEKRIDLNFFNEITEAERNTLQNALSSNPLYKSLKDVTIYIKGSDTKSFELITTAYQDKKEELEESKILVEGLRKKIEDLEQTISNLNNRIEQEAINRNEEVIAFSTIAKDAKIRYIDIQEIGYSNVISTKDFIKIDTIPMLNVKWTSGLTKELIEAKEMELKAWLQKTLALDTLLIYRNE